MPLGVVLPHDGERSHVQSDPGSWLKLCFVQLQNKETLRDETWQHRKKWARLLSWLLSCTFLNMNQLMSVCYMHVYWEPTCLRHPTTYRGPLVALTMTGINKQNMPECHQCKVKLAQSKIMPWSWMLPRKGRYLFKRWLGLQGDSQAWKHDMIWTFMGKTRLVLTQGATVVLLILPSILHS